MPLQEVAYVGDALHADAHTISYDAMLNVAIARNLRPSWYAGTGAPTFTATKGSLYSRLDGGTGTVLYVNSSGSTTWQVVTSA